MWKENIGTVMVMRKLCDRGKLLYFEDLHDTGPFPRSAMLKAV